MGFPLYRGRRLRRTSPLRAMVRETSLNPEDLILPLFVVPGEGIKEPVEAMPGVCRFSPDRIVEPVREAEKVDVPAVLLFGVPDHKDERGSEAMRSDGLVQEAIQRIKNVLPEMVVITDVCLCAYMSHGHCGVVREGSIVNDESLELLARMATSHAAAGADMVAPSDMMDGRVLALRKALDGEGFQETSIMSYAAKFASSFYGPFREAAESAPTFGDRRSYQMDPANPREALREVRMDVEEGADIVMVKPALPYLDIICRVRQEVDLPVAAYHVSGEYSMVKAAGARGWIDEAAVALEILLSIRRAGADLILTYNATEVASHL